jgi:RNase P/RNase MRP subunit p29
MEICPKLEDYIKFVRIVFGRNGDSKNRSLCGRGGLVVGQERDLLPLQQAQELKAVPFAQLKDRSERKTNLKRENAQPQL